VDDLSDADVVLLYMGDDINERLKPILKKTLKPGARVVSHRFLMGDDWKPDKTEKLHVDGEDFEIHLWEIGPAEKKKAAAGGIGWLSSYGPVFLAGERDVGRISNPSA
jgi:hypothetical protein